MTELTNKQQVFLVTRKSAKESGERFYYTGKSCKHGHTSIRYSITGQCVACHKSIYLPNKKALPNYKEKHKTDAYRWVKRINEEKQGKAVNKSMRWSFKDLKEIFRTNGMGVYLSTTSQLADLLGRTYMSIEGARERYKDKRYRYARD